MAVSSPLNPNSIVNEKRASMPAAMNFISGGSPLGSSVLSSAANKIVGFQRGAAAVSPKLPDLASIIKTLSTNILNNVENRLQSVNQSIQQVIQKNFINQLGEYREKLNSIDNDTPNRFLRNFLSLYKNAIEYIQFLGNRKNAKTLGDNLKALQQIFTETFQVAKIIRQTIVKIVNQLSNLPKASAGGSGIDIDVKVPGGPLKKSMPSKASMLKMIGMAGAIGGAGMLGSKVVSGMMDVGEGSQVSAVSSEIGQGLSGPLLDRFNAILDRFDSAINALATRRPATSEPRSTSGSTQQPSDEDSTNTTGTSGATSAISSAPGDEKLAAFVASMEASSPENAADALQVMLNRAASGYSKQGLAGVISGREQFSPLSAAIYGTSRDKNAARKYGPIAARLPGNTPQEKFKYLQQVASGPDGLQQLQRIFAGGSANVAATILNDPKYLEMSRKNVRGALNFGAGSIAQPGDVKIRQGGNYFYNFTGKIGTLSGQPSANVISPSPQVIASPTKSVTQKEISKTVSQPPATQSKSQVNVVPLNMSSPQTQSTPVGEKVPPPPTLTKGGATVPFLTSTNHDNFMTLYSKIVYNLVD